MSLQVLFAVIQCYKYSHALSKIETCDPSFWMIQDHMCHILHGHCDQLGMSVKIQIKYATIFEFYI